MFEKCALWAPMLSIMLREGTREDFGSATELLNRVWPLRVGSERGLQHSAAAEPPDAYRRYWAAEDGGELVGWATAAIDYQSSERPGFLQVSVATDDVSFEQWLEDYWRHPDTDLDASVAAVVDGRPVAFSHLRVAPGGRAITDMTGTLRDYRGRGLALLAKRATLVNAARRGIELVSTENDETNGPMLRINEKLGYRPVGSTLGWSRP